MANVNQALDAAVGVAGYILAQQVDKKYQQMKAKIKKEQTKVKKKKKT